MGQWQAQIIVSVVTVAGSFVVAWFTAKHQMKKELFDRRYGVYRAIISYLYNLKRSPGYKSDWNALSDLLNLEADARLCGTECLVSLLVELREELEHSLDESSRVRAYGEYLYNCQYDYIRDKYGESSPEMDSFYKEQALDGEESGEPIALKDDYLDKKIDAIIRELKRSIGNRELRFAVWFRKTGFYGKSCPWV